MENKTALASDKIHQNHNNRTFLGYGSVLIGFIICPCHLPFTLPIIAAITSGTILGVLFNEFWFIVVIMSIIIFFGGLIGGTYLINAGKDIKENNCEKCRIFLRSESKQTF